MSILLQTLFFKINDSRDNAVRVLEKMVFCLVTVDVFLGSDFYQIGFQDSRTND